MASSSAVKEHLFIVDLKPKDDRGQTIQKTSTSQISRGLMKQCIRTLLIAASIPIVFFERLNKYVEINPHLFGETVNMKALKESQTCTKTSSLPNGWCMDSTNVPRYVGPNFNNDTTNITHYNYEGYIKCLAGKTIVTIGESRVRYQYMHLTGYLRYKKPMVCSDKIQYQTNKTKEDSECYLIDYERIGGRPNWALWYKRKRHDLFFLCIMRLFFSSLPLSSSSLLCIIKRAQTCSTIQIPTPHRLANVIAGVLTPLIGKDPLRIDLHEGKLYMEKSI